MVVVGSESEVVEGVAVRFLGRSWARGPNPHAEEDEEVERERRGEDEEEEGEGRAARAEGSARLSEESVCNADRLLLCIVCCVSKAGRASKPPREYFRFILNFDFHSFE